MAENNNLEKNKQNLIKQKELYLYELSLKLGIDLQNYNEDEEINPSDPIYNLKIIIRKNINVLKQMI